jgi:SAM-dependent methyltransferase
METENHSKPIYKQPVRFLLKAEKAFRARLVDPFAIKLFGGLHPKNVFQYRAQFFQEFLSPNDRVIDIACGTGAALHYLAPHVQAGLGIEMNSTVVAIAKARSPENVSYVQANIFEVDYAKIQREFRYNVAIFSHILEHLEQPEEILKQVNASKVLICVPSEENWYRQLLKNMGLDHRSDPDHVREYDRASVRSILEKTGYRVTFVGFNPEGEIMGVGER